MKRKRIIEISFLAILLICIFACKSQKAAVSLKLPEQQEQITSSNANPETKSAINGIKAQGCLPQDEPFLDSLKLSLYRFNVGGPEMTYSYIDSVPAIVRELFPKVIFFNSTIWIDVYSQPLIMAYYNNRKYICTNNFNILFKDVNPNNAECDIKDKVTAFLYMFYGYNSHITISDIVTTSITIPYDIYTYNLKASANINGSTYKLIFFLSKSQLLSFREYESNSKIKKHLYIDETP